MTSHDHMALAMWLSLPLSLALPLREGRSELPPVGLRAPPALLPAALAAGLRMAQTSQRHLAEAMRKQRLGRQEVFVQSVARQGFDEAHRHMRQLLRQLRLDYVATRTAFLKQRFWVEL